MKPRPAQLLYLCLTLALTLACAPAHALVIDDFDDDFDPSVGFLLAFGAGGTDDDSASPTTGSGILGTEAEHTIAITTGSSPLTADRAVALSGFDTLGYSIGTASNGTLTITYDGVGSAGLGGIDLTDGGASTDFVFDIVEKDPLEATILITVTDTDGDSDTETLLLSDVAISSLETRTLSFSLYDSPVDFTSVDSIVLVIHGGSSTTETAALDINIDRFTTGVPEPGHAALALVMGVAACLRRRRRWSPADRQ